MGARSACAPKGRRRRSARTSRTRCGTGSRSRAGTTSARCSGTSARSAAACARSIRWARRARVRALLEALGVKHHIDTGLVRGLDYYTGTIFEIKTKAGELGAQNTVAGGGRYDRLVASLGGQSTPAIGFALGIERALLA